MSYIYNSERYSSSFTTLYNVPHNRNSKWEQNTINLKGGSDIMKQKYEKEHSLKKKEIMPEDKRFTI